MLKRHTPFITVFIAPLAIEFLVAMTLDFQPVAILSRLVLLAAALLGILAIRIVLRFLVKQQILLMAVVQILLGLVLTSAGVSASLTHYPIAGVFSAGCVLAGLAIVGTSTYMVIADLHHIDVKMVPSAEESHRWIHHSRSTERGEMVYARTFNDIPYQADLFEDCLNTIGSHGVHFIAVFSTGSCQFHIDAFGNSALNGYIAPFTADERRTRFERAGRQLVALDGRLAAGFGSIERGTLVRFIVDVEDGGLFLYRLRRGHYLMGVTLRQSQILLAQRKLDALALKHQRFPNGEPYAPLVRVRDLVTEYPVVSTTTSALDAAYLLVEHDVASVLVVTADGLPFAALSAADLLRRAMPAAIQDDPASARLFDSATGEPLAGVLGDLTVGECLPMPATSPLVIDGKTPAVEVAAMMTFHDRQLAAAVEGDRLLGVITLNSLIDVCIRG